MSFIEASEQELLTIGETLHRKSAHWHLHVLTPECTLNTRASHAIVLEDTDQGRHYIAYSEYPMPETALRLASFVHGDSATQPPAENEPDPESPVVQEMMSRAKVLMAEGKHWHHHIFFPTCIFNPHPGKWTMIFEDPLKHETLTSVTDGRPDKDIGITERLFYAQRN
jgi:hypothetical protein